MTNISNPGNAPLPCPAWCTTDHTEQDQKSAKTLARVRERTGQPDYTPDWMARWHTRTVAQIPNPAAGPKMTVAVTLYRDDTLTNPDPDRAVVGAEHADCMNSTTAVELAAALLGAVAILRDDPVLADGLAKVGSRVRTGERQVDESIDAGAGRTVGPMTGDEFDAYLDRLDAEATAEEKGESR